MARIDIDETALYDLLHDPAGPVGREIARRGDRVVHLAQVYTSTVGAGIMWPEFVRTRLRGVPRGTPGRLVMWGPPSGHRSSVPGAHPALDTGRLEASIGMRVTETVYGPSADIYADPAVAPYAKWVELGTRYMDERPYLRPALYEGAAG